MCCLTYEHESYVQARKRFPREGKTLRTGIGRERVVSVDIWRDHVLLKDDAGNRRSISLEQLKAEVAAAPPDDGEPTAVASPEDLPRSGNGAQNRPRRGRYGQERDEDGGNGKADA
jgi:hypothetical protein